MVVLWLGELVFREDGGDVLVMVVCGNVGREWGMVVGWWFLGMVVVGVL